MLKRIAQALTAQTDAASAAAFRIAFGILAFIAVARYFRNDWIARLYIEPAHHFPHWDLTLLQPLPDWGMYALFAALALFAAGIALGLYYRICAALFCIGFAYIELLDRATYLNHHYLMILVTLLMAFLPLNRAASLDARRRPPSDGVMPASIPAWTLWTLRAQIGAVYLFAGIAKLNPDWLLNAMPLRIWLYQRGDIPIIGALLQETWTAYAMSWTGALFDLTIVAWLLWRRSRPWAYLALIAFHLITWLLFPRLGMFPLLMIGGALIFFPPDWPRRLFNRKRKPQAQQQPVATPTARRISWTARAAIAAASLFALTQIILPLRHFAYPGNVRWNDEGYRFAWRVMLTEKVRLHAIPRALPRKRTRPPCRPGGILHAAANRAYGDPAGYDTAGRAYHRRRFSRARLRCASQSRRLCGIQRPPQRPPHTPRRRPRRHQPRHSPQVVDTAPAPPKAPPNRRPRPCPQTPPIYRAGSPLRCSAPA